MQNGNFKSKTNRLSTENELHLNQGHTIKTIAMFAQYFSSATFLTVLIKKKNLMGLLSFVNIIVLLLFFFQNSYKRCDVVAVYC
jgi:hypothetical protein